MIQQQQQQQQNQKKINNGLLLLRIQKCCNDLIDNIHIDRITKTTGLENVPLLSNVVMTVHLNQKQDLSLPVSCFKNCKRNVAQFASLVIKYDSPKSTGLLFSAGILVSVGTRSKNVALYSLYILRKELNRIGSGPNFVSADVSNYVFTSHLGYWIDIARLSTEYEQYCVYEPDKFPGCSYQPPEIFNNNGGKFVLFEGGAFNIVGVTTILDGKKAYKYIISFANKFKKEPRNDSDRTKLVSNRVQEKKDAVEQQQDSIIY